MIKLHHGNTLGDVKCNLVEKFTISISIYLEIMLLVPCSGPAISSNDPTTKNWYTLCHQPC